MFGRRIYSVAVAILVVLVVAVSGCAPPVSSGGGHGHGHPGNATAFVKLVTDLHVAEPAALKPLLKLKLLGEALEATALAVRNHSCAALELLIDMETQLARALTPGADRRPAVSATEAELLRADILSVRSYLLSTGGTARCGGSISPPAEGEVPLVTRGASDTNHLVLHVTFPQASLTTRHGGGRTFTELTIPGFSPGVGDAIGKPGVPTTGLSFAIPPGAEVSADVVGTSGYDLGGASLWPTQDQAADATTAAGGFDSPPFAINPDAYASRLEYPPSPAVASNRGQLRDLQIGSLTLAGAQYLPAVQRLHVFTGVDVDVRFTGQHGGTFGTADLTSLWNLPAQHLYQRHLVNYDTVVKALSPGIARLLCGEENLIVTSPLLRPAADTLAAARTADGISTNVVETGNGAGKAGTTTTAIRQYLIGEEQKNCRIHPSYLTIFGDTANVPTFLPDTPWSITGFDGKIATDVPYGFIHQTVSGVQDNYFSDVAIGRIPAGDLATATTEVEKIIAYEDHPPTASSFYTHMTFAGLFQGCDGTNPCGETDTRTFLRTLETIRDWLVKTPYTIDRQYNSDVGAPKYYDDGRTTTLLGTTAVQDLPFGGTAASINADINAGRFLVFHRDHGSPSGWGNPGYGTGSVAALTNGNLTPVVLSVNCASGKFDDSTANFAEQFLQKSGGGAVGVIGDTRNSPSGINSDLAKGLFGAIFPQFPAYLFDVLFNGNPDLHATTRMGDVLLEAKLYTADQDAATGAGLAEQYLYNYLGDPTMNIQTTAPRLFSRGIKFEVGSSILRLSLANTDSDGAVATLERDGQAIGRGIVTGGQVSIATDYGLESSASAQVDPALLQGVTLSLERPGFVPTLIPIVAAPSR